MLHTFQTPETMVPRTSWEHRDRGRSNTAVGCLGPPPPRITLGGAVGRMARKALPPARSPLMYSMVPSSTRLRSGSKPFRIPLACSDHREEKRRGARSAADLGAACRGLTPQAGHSLARGGYGEGTGGFQEGLLDGQR